MVAYQEVAEEIYQVCLPLPLALKSVNCYLLRGDEGWTILDTGLNVPAAQQVWRTVFTELGIQPGDIRQIILTHAHPDHYGLAGWLQNWCGAPVWMSAREAEQVAKILARRSHPNGILGQTMSTNIPPEMVAATNAAIDKLWSPDLTLSPNGSTSELRLYPPYRVALLPNYPRPRSQRWPAYVL